ncbi:hypothetical protein ACFOET_16415 [Parapedobacter deserti]|uniref:FkbM family methyltransferase n=1 Tax=Parapedobacter deserti TaxID=1912957 RepID=A0ABV7JQZ4_9SPHI
MESVKLLITFCIRYGFWSGLRLYFKPESGRVGHNKLASVKHPFSLQANTSDIDAFYQVFYNNHYDIELAKLRVLIDRGANVGLFTMKNRYPGAKVICVEPDNENSISCKGVSAAMLHDVDKRGCSRSFFEAINRALPQYAFSVKGENVIIENMKYNINRVYTSVPNHLTI